ncbi:hypothetical protein, partial [Bacillus altitudinis]|uniref:hypothetical protein n=1 Tax=Bacillus altitudinis TaxID=293387 RepID=UPI001F32479E
IQIEVEKVIFTRNFAKTQGIGANYGLKDASCDVESPSDGVRLRFFRLKKIRAKIRSKLVEICENCNFSHKSNEFRPSEDTFSKITC